MNLPDDPLHLGRVVEHPAGGPQALLALAERLSRTQELFFGPLPRGHGVQVALAPVFTALASVNEADWNVWPLTPVISAPAAAFVAVLFTIGGWQQLNMVAGEIRRPLSLRPVPIRIRIG